MVITLTGARYFAPNNGDAVESVTSQRMCSAGFISLGLAFVIVSPELITERLSSYFLGFFAIPKLLPIILLILLLNTSPNHY